MYDTVEAMPDTKSVGSEDMPDGAQGIIMEFAHSKFDHKRGSALVEFELCEYPDLSFCVQIIEVKYLKVVV